ncbi:MAG: hypothetical protein JW751_27665 [Polyangiaceae bacterium]|nr:hypothetical protein [Polyangiaceae bacterium]
MTKEDEVGRARPDHLDVGGEGSSREAAGSSSRDTGAAPVVPSATGADGAAFASIADAVSVAGTAAASVGAEEAASASTADDGPGNLTTPSAADRSSPDAADEGADLRHLLRGALLREEPEPPDVLRGVQRKIRTRSGGKFFSDGWSTERQPPTQTYLVTTLVMLAVIIAIWVVLYPISGSPKIVEPPPPINVLPPQ